MSLFHDIDEYFTHVVERLRINVETRRREDRALNLLAVEANAVKPSKNALTVDKVYFYAKNNAAEHRTIRYELVHRTPETPVFRRGAAFMFVIRFADGRTFNHEKDTLRLHFNYGPAPSVVKNTQGVLVVKDNEDFLRDHDQWDVRVVGKDRDTITLQVQIPTDVPVGVWRLQIFTGEASSPNKLRLYDCPNDVYVLFNPWCEDDDVHMEGEDDEKGSKLLDEYVLADVGKIWMGSYRSASGRQWVYGQYDDACLPVCVYLLERCGLSHHERSDPVLVVRALTKMVNSNDGDNGILDGRWDGKYDEGTAPSAWTGSVKILEDYLLTRRSVKYGQCWVFAGVLTTVCRALGIPARPVSNLVSAHDANGTLTIDRYYDAKNNELDYDPFNPSGGTDSIWNFHVWVEAWMARPDLPKGYGGWQAVDATPQERSDGFFQLGPASLEAVKKGQIGLAYDVGFVLAEVNADLVRWREDKSSEIGFVRIDTNKYNIGRQILTKKAFVYDPTGNSDAEDVTASYKPDEGTEEERIGLYNAARSSQRAKRFFRSPDQAVDDVEFDLIELEIVPLGEPFSVVVLIKNNSKQVRTVNAVLSATTNYYNGVKAHEVRRATAVFVLQPNSREELRLPVNSQDYISKLVEYGMMKLHAAATVKETNQSWIEEDDFQIIMPSVDVSVSGPAKVAKPLEITFNFVNTLKMPLTHCKLRYECPGLSRPEVREVPDVTAGGTMSHTVRLTPKYTGDHGLVVSFDSKQFAEIVGSTKILVTK